MAKIKFVILAVRVAFRVSEGSIPICSSISLKPVIMYNRSNAVFL
jgi:hypothetical protein